MRRELDSLSLSSSFSVCLSCIHGRKPVPVHTHVSLLNGHRELPVDTVNKVVGGLTKIPSSAKPLVLHCWISRLPFHNVHDLDCSYNRKQGEMGGGEKKSSTSEHESVKKQSAAWVPCLLQTADYGIRLCPILPLVRQIIPPAIKNSKTKEKLIKIN